MFHIVHKKTGSIWVNSKNVQEKFSTGKEAKVYIEKFCGEDWEPRKAATDTKWRERERKRLSNGGYLPLPPFLQPIALPDHYLHMSKKKFPELCHTQSEEKGMQDLQTNISLVGYIETYHPKMTKVEKDKLIKEFDKFILSHDGLLFATTPEEIERVYKQNSVHSCMTGHKEVGVYGAGDLAVAYLYSSDGKTVMARAICWPEKKVYCRVYGSEDLHKKLKARDFIKSGYYKQNERANETYGNFEGARLLAVRQKDRKDYFQCPSLDEPTRFDYDADNNVFIFKQKGKYQSGALGPLPHAEKCPGCHTVKILDQKVYVSRKDSEDFCADCAKQIAMSEGGIFVHKTKIPFYNVRGQMRSDIWVQSRGFICEGSGDFFDYPRACYTVNVDGKKQLWAFRTIKARCKKGPDGKTLKNAAGEYIAD